MTTLIVIDQPPYGASEGRDAMDMAFSLAAFDQPVSLLFSGAGVNWLRKGQAADHIGQKTLEKNLAAAPIFGVKEVLADRISCRNYALNEGLLQDNVQLVEVNSELLGRFTHTLFSG